MSDLPVGHCLLVDTQSAVASRLRTSAARLPAATLLRSLQRGSALSCPGDQELAGSAIGTPCHSSSKAMLSKKAVASTTRPSRIVKNHA